MHRNAIVCLALGNAYAEAFARRSYPRAKAYCEAIGADLIVFTSPLDVTERAQARSPAWQKLLVFTQPEVIKYENVCFIDSDILINPASPNIFDAAADTVGLVRPPTPQANPLNRLIAQAQQDRIHAFIHSLGCKLYRTAYEPFGIEDDHPHDFNTGVLLAQPKRHGLFFMDVYYGYEDAGSAVYNYEQWPLVHELIAQNAFHEIDPLFNVILNDMLVYHHGYLMDTGAPPGTFDALIARIVEFYLSSAYFVHFAGLAHLWATVDVPYRPAAEVV